MDHYHHQYHHQTALTNNPYSSNLATAGPATRTPTATLADQKKMASRPQEPLNCPRCNSTNTKFCYYNNYSLSQPRYLCKTCRRYWTEGGSLRNVPVGGGSRKNKKLPHIPTPSSSSSSASKVLPDLNPPFVFSSSTLQNPNKTQSNHHDLSLSFSDSMHDDRDQGRFSHFANPTSSSSLEGHNFLMFNQDLGPPNRGMIQFHQEEYDRNKARLGFSLDGQEEILGNSAGNEEGGGGGGSAMFPYGDIKQIVPTNGDDGQGHSHNDIDHQKHVDVTNKRQGSSSNELWNGVILGGGPTW